MGIFTPIYDILQKCANFALGQEPQEVMVKLGVGMVIRTLKK